MTSQKTPPTALPQGFLTFGEDAFDKLQEAVENFIDCTVAVVPVGAPDAYADDVSAYDMFLVEVDGQAVRGRLLDDDGEPGPVPAEHSWTDILRIHLY